MAKGVGLRVLSMGGSELDHRGVRKVLDTGAPARGHPKAKEAGKYGGQAPTARRKAEEIQRLRADGVKPTEIAVRLGIGRASVYRVLGSAELTVSQPVVDRPSSSTAA